MGETDQTARFNGVIFDFNGVLWWDADLQVASWRTFSDHLRGYPLDEAEIAVHVHGRTNGHTMAYLLGRPVVGEELEALSEQKEAIYRRFCLDQGTAFRLSTGAPELLDWLSACGIRRTIATASAWPNVAFFNEHLGLARWFNLGQVVYDDGLRPGKPAPDPYLAAASTLGLPPERCMVVEDSRSGLASAVAAGMGFVIALGPTATHPDLRDQLGVQAVIEHLGQFPRHLLSDV